MIHLTGYQVKPWRVELIGHSSCHDGSANENVTYKSSGYSLRWLTAVSISYTLTDEYYHCLSVDTKLMVPNKRLINGEQVIVIFST